MVDVPNATQPAASSTGAGLVSQKYFSPVRAEKSVRKSEMEIFRYMDVVIWPYDKPPRPQL